MRRKKSLGARPSTEKREDGMDMISFHQRPTTCVRVREADAGHTWVITLLEYLSRAQCGPSLLIRCGLRKSGNEKCEKWAGKNLPDLVMNAIFVAESVMFLGRVTWPRVPRAPIHCQLFMTNVRNLQLLFHFFTLLQYFFLSFSRHDRVVDKWQLFP